MCSRSRSASSTTPTAGSARRRLLDTVTAPLVLQSTVTDNPVPPYDALTQALNTPEAQSGLAASFGAGATATVVDPSHSDSSGRSYNRTALIASLVAIGAVALVLLGVYVHMYARKTKNARAALASVPKSPLSKKSGAAPTVDVMNLSYRPGDLGSQQTCLRLLPTEYSHADDGVVHV
eukprot:m.41349 g.41349  ORF g.41349 m.41349 type:complete len:178 (-) comp11994_c1_seq1:1563-2096(-)